MREVVRLKRLGKLHHPVVPLVPNMQQGDPVEGIGTQASHAGRFGVP
jgi:hypothetical protein